MQIITAETADGPISIEAEEGRKLVLAIEDSGIDILHRCGGNARCTTCRVEILSGDPGPIGDAGKSDSRDQDRSRRPHAAFVSGPRDGRPAREGHQSGERQRARSRTAA